MIAKVRNREAVLKLKDTHAGNTLSTSKKVVTFNTISYPTANVNYAIEPQSRGEEDKMAAGLSTTHEEDPFKYEFEEIKVISAGTRDADAEGLEGMSASKLRKAAIDGVC